MLATISQEAVPIVVHHHSFLGLSDGWLAIVFVIIMLAGVYACHRVIGGEPEQDDERWKH